MNQPDPALPDAPRAPRLARRAGATLALALGLALALPPREAPAACADVTPPVVRGTVARPILWPATRGLLPVGLDASSHDERDGALATTVRIYSDEGDGPPPFTPDALHLTPRGQGLALRAERDYPGPAGNRGRAYVLALSATDAAGNTGHACVTVVVPLMPTAAFLLGVQAEAAAGVALCIANGGTIPPARGWSLLHAFTLTPPIGTGPDGYDCIGNVRLDVPAPGVLANDSTSDPPLTISNAGSFASSQGGEVALAASGAFTYDPPAGFAGCDTFPYGVTDTSGRTALGTVTITVTGMIWFIDNTVGPGGDGRQTTPFGSFADFTTLAADRPGDVIHVARGDGTTGGYDSGIRLLPDQALYGAGVSLAGRVSFAVPPFNRLPGAGTRPVVTNPGGAAITTTGGNTVRGLDVSSPAGAGLLASGAGLTCSEMTIAGGAAGSGGLAFLAVSGAVDVDDVDVVAPLGDGITLASCTGTFDFDADCSVTDAGLVDFRVSAGTCAVTYNGDLSQSTGGGLVSVLGNHVTGALVFQAGTLACTSGSGIRIGPCSNATTFRNAMSLTTAAATDAIVLRDATGTTRFTDLTVVSGGDGIRASGGGAIHVAGTSSITSTGGAALDLSSASLAMTFSALASASSASHGIRISSCSGSLACTGPTRLLEAAADGIAVSGSGGMDLDFTTLDLDGIGGDGIDVRGGVGAFDVATATTIDDAGGTGIRVADCPGDTFTFGDTDIGADSPCQGGVSLTSSAGATFGFADVDVVQNVGIGLLCDDAGTIHVDALPTIHTIGAAAIDVTSTEGSMNGTGGFAFDDVVSTDSTTVGIRFELVASSILLTDVDIDSSSPAITNGIVFTDCTGASKTVRRGHVVLTGTNDANGVFVDNSDAVTIEGDGASAFDAIGTAPAYAPVLTGGFELTGMGTGSALQVINGNATGHHAINCHDSNGLTVDRCHVHDVGDLMDLDGHVDAGVFVDETTAGTVTITRSYFEGLAASPAALLGSPASLFTGTSAFRFTFNRVVGDPALPSAGNPACSTHAAVQGAFASTSGATTIGNFDDNRIEGVGFSGIVVAVDLDVAGGDSGTGPGGRNVFSASRNFVSDVDNEAIEFMAGDDSRSLVLLDDNTCDASRSHATFDVGPRTAFDVALVHDGATFTPVLDLFIRNNLIRSTNAATQDWADNGIRVETSSATGAGPGTIRALIANNRISEFENQAIELQADESNIVNAIVRDNTCDSSHAPLSATQGVIDLDDQSSSDPEVMRVWLDGNETGTPNAGGADVGYRIEEITGPTIELACESGCPVSGTITTNADLVTLLRHNGNTSDGGGPPTVDASPGDVVVIPTAALPAPSVRATGLATRRVGSCLADTAAARILLEAAKRRWLDAGIGDDEAGLLRSVTLAVADLPGVELARVWVTHITLDATAAGHGWHLEATRGDDARLHATAASEGGAADGGMDLLTVLMHEIGHVLGRGHEGCGTHLMGDELEPGVRRLPATKANR